MLRLKESIRLYFSDSDEKRNADFVLRLLFEYFPGSEVRLKTSKCTATFLLDDMEDFEPEPIVSGMPSHAEKVMRYFAEKEKVADEIFKEAAGELRKLGKDDLIKRLKTAVTFYESGDWIDDDNLARKKMSTNQESKNEDQELQEALAELVSEFEKALLKVELPKNRKAFDMVRKETEKLLEKVFEDGAETKAIKFDLNDKATFPKREGSYLAFNEANIGFVAFWAEFDTRSSERNGSNVFRKRRWIADYEVAAYCPIPLSQLCKSI